jgi:hypothetical protein
MSYALGMVGDDVGLSFRVTAFTAFVRRRG